MIDIEVNHTSLMILSFCGRARTTELLKKFTSTNIPFPEPL